MHYKGGVRSRRSAEQILAELLRGKFSDQKHPVIIAIGGPGGTGKTTISEKLAGLLGDAAVLHLDHYKTPRSARQDNNLLGSHPEANRVSLIREHVAQIRNGESFDTPVYDDVTGEIQMSGRYESNRYNILDGEISTYRQFRDLIDFSVFIDSDWKTQLNTRLFRDIQDRGYSKEKVIHIFLQSNLRDFAKYGAEAKKWADVHLYCTAEYRLLVESISRELFGQFENMLGSDLAAVDISGLFVPVLTPFDENNKVDQSKYIEHLEYLTQQGVHRVLVNGTTGEFFSLTLDERRMLLRLTRTYFPGVILFQAGTESLIQTQEEIRWAEEDGADGVLVLPPYYLAGVSEKGLIEYFNTIAGAVSVPMIIYNFPRHTGNPMTPEILQSVNHFGMKDSSANLDLIPHTPKYFIGGDEKLQRAFALGASGCISARSNVMPSVFVAMEDAVKSNPEAIPEIQNQINRLCRIIGGGNEIPKIKALMSLVIPGYPATLRLPLLELGEKEKGALKRVFGQYRNL